MGVFDFLPDDERQRAIDALAARSGVPPLLQNPDAVPAPAPPPPAGGDVVTPEKLVGFMDTMRRRNAPSPDEAAQLATAQAADRQREQMRGIESGFNRAASLITRAPQAENDLPLPKNVLEYQQQKAIRDAQRKAAEDADKEALALMQAAPKITTENVAARYAEPEAAAKVRLGQAHADVYEQQARKGASELADSEAFRGALRNGDSRATAVVRALAQKYGGAAIGDVSDASGAELHPLLKLMEEGYKAEQAAKARELSIRGMAAGSSLGDDAVDIAAAYYLRTGQLPALGRDAQARARIMTRAAQIAKGGEGPSGDIATNKANLHADQASLQKQTTLLDLTKSWEATGKANLGVLRSISKQLVDTGSPWVNQPVRKVYEKGSGDPTVSKFKAAHAAVVNEYAKILSGSTSSAGITDAARREANEMLPLDATPAQLAAAADVLETDAGNRLGALSRGLEATKERISGKKAAPEAEPAAARPRRTVNGETREWDGKAWVPIAAVR